MSAREALRRLEAFRAGRPLPRGSTLHLPIAEDQDLLLLAFVKMGGEALPWAVGVGRPGEKPRVFFAAEPRRRDDLADAATAFAPLLLEHLGHPEHPNPRRRPYEKPAEGEEAKRQDFSKPYPLWQVWVPSGPHLEMLHGLGAAYARTRVGDEARVALLRALGRASAWLFREAKRPGQVHIVDASAALRESYTFPAEDARAAHLGLLLAWLEAAEKEGEREARERAAEEAESLSVSTSLDPTLERDVLAPMLGRLRDAERLGDEKARGEALEIRAALGRLLEAELGRRIDLLGRAIARLREDPRPENPGLPSLVLEGEKARIYGFLKPELPRDETEEKRLPADWGSAAAAARFSAHAATESLRFSSLVHHDAEMQADAVAEGQAFAGVLASVEDRGSGRTRRPHWRVEEGGKAPLRLREGDKVCVAGLPKREAVIRAIEDGPDGRVLLLEITNLKLAAEVGGERVPSAVDPFLVGTRFVFVPVCSSSLDMTRSMRVWQAEGLGAWLTHGVRPDEEEGKTERPGAPEPEAELPEEEPELFDALLDEAESEAEGGPDPRSGSEAGRAFASELFGEARG